MARESGVQSLVESYQKLKKMLVDASLFNTQPYKVRFKGKVEQSRERGRVFLYSSVEGLLKGSLQVTVDYERLTLTFL